jgi:hypothetical protein
LEADGDGREGLAEKLDAFQFQCLNIAEKSRRGPSSQMGWSKIERTHEGQYRTSARRGGAMLSEGFQSWRCPDSDGC